MLALADTPLETMKQVLDQLHQLGIQKTIMLTSDSEGVARAIAATLFSWAGIGWTSGET